VEAASMPCVYGTVIHSLIDKVGIDGDQTVLNQSTCGGVGIAAIQICQMRQISTNRSDTSS
jgi:NADPH:quinone reductase-like Zn-dependent oxidoreductase